MTTIKTADLAGAVAKLRAIKPVALAVTDAVSKARAHFAAAMAHGMRKAATELTARGRRQLSPASFALPGRRYPIHDERHARNALARVAQHGTPSEQNRVRQAVHARYPHIE